MASLSMRSSTSPLQHDIYRVGGCSSGCMVRKCRTCCVVPLLQTAASLLQWHLQEIKISRQSWSIVKQGMSQTSIAQGV